MRRRRMIVALALMLFVGSWITWRMMHRRDPQLVGRWLFTRGAAATQDDLRLAANRGNGDQLEWIFDPNGTGRQYSEFWLSGVRENGFSPFTWWTDGECVHVEWGNPQQGWAAVRQTLYEIRRLLQGDRSARQPDVYTYSAAEETDTDPQQFVLEFQTATGLRTDDTYYLSRIEEPDK